MTQFTTVNDAPLLIIFIASRGAFNRNAAQVDGIGAVGIDRDSSPSRRNKHARCSHAIVYDAERLCNDQSAVARAIKHVDFPAGVRHIMCALKGPTGCCKGARVVIVPVARHERSTILR